MRTWFTTRNGAMTLIGIVAIGVSLVLVGVIFTQGLTARTATASLLILCFVLFAVGGVLFSGRAFLKWPIEETSSHLIWERGFIIAAVLATVLGLALLEDLLRGAGDSFLARLGMVAYLVAAGMVVVAETMYVGKRDWIYPQIVFYVLVAFLAQAAIGIALLQTGMVASWAGWTTVIWNLAWLLIMLIVRPADIYFPVLHHVAPLIIGVALLVG